jgi:hypothetical protein
VTLHNAPAVFHPVITSAALALATLTLLAVLFTLMHLHEVRRGHAKEDA